MSLSDQIAADVGGVFLNEDDFAETVTHYPAGDSEAEADVIGVFAEQTMSRETERGEQRKRTAELTVASGLTLHRKDLWSIRGETWSTVTWGDDGPGMVKIELQIVNPQTRKLAGKDLL